LAQDGLRPQVVMDRAIKPGPPNFLTGRETPFSELCSMLAY